MYLLIGYICNVLRSHNIDIFVHSQRAAGCSCTQGQCTCPHVAFDSMVTNTARLLRDRTTGYLIQPSGGTACIWGSIHYMEPKIKIIVIYVLYISGLMLLITKHHISLQYYNYSKVSI